MQDDVTDTARPAPLVSIGMPVYNTERYIGKALDSLLAQTLGDFEIVISDNASTDRTGDICREYAARDLRIRYLRQPENIGLPRNWNAVVHAARGEYFKWASASDFCSPDMLEKCIAAMRADAGIVLCFGKTQNVDEEGQCIDEYQGDTSFEQECPSARFGAVLQELSRNNAQCGVVRLEVLRRTALDRTYPAGDMVLMAELALYGKFKLLPEVMLYRRQTKATLTSLLSPRELQRAFNPKSASYVKMLRLRWHWDAFCSVWRAAVPFFEKLRATGSVMRSLIWERARIWREFLSLFSR